MSSCSSFCVSSSFNFSRIRLQHDRLLACLAPRQHPGCPFLGPQPPTGRSGWSCRSPPEEILQAGRISGFARDFLVYSTIPISCGLAVSTLDDLKQPFASLSPSNSPWLSIAVLEATFSIANFVLFYGSSVIERQKRDGKTSKESTELAARPALVESFESGVIFTFMLGWPKRIEALSWAMALLVEVGTIHRVQWLLSAL